MLTNKNENFQLDQFAMHRYNCIVKYKTAYYSTILPIKIGEFIEKIQNRKKIEKDF